MDLALVMLIIWALIFVPIGLVIHGFVLGETARIRALPLAPITGLATGFVLLTALARLGFSAGTSWVIWLLIAAAVSSIIIIWRAQFAWRSRELIGSTLLFLLAVIFVQIAVIGAPTDGPLGYGTVANPVEEVAAIEAAADPNHVESVSVNAAAKTAGKRPIAFEQFAGLTVSIGQSEKSELNEASWSAYSLHAPLTGMLAALVSLPLFAFARARGVRWFGLIFLVPIGVLAPYTFLALANGAGSAIAALPFFTAAVFSMLVSRRDRGWWSLTLLFASALAVTAGPLALLPLLVLGAVWALMRSNTYEHLALKDKPVAKYRSQALAWSASALAALGVASTLRAGGSLLAWPQLHTHLFDTVRSWPFAWLDTKLQPAGPVTLGETIVWFAGPALLIIAALHAVNRSERRELTVLVGFVSALVVAFIAALFSHDAGIRLFEFVVFALSPLLAALAVRAVSLTRERVEGVRGRSRFARIASFGPTLLATGFVVLSLAATSVTGSRMVHAPALSSVQIEPGSALVAGGDQWLTFILDGERTKKAYADADELIRNKELSTHSLLEQGYNSLVLGASPLASDPPSRYTESTKLDSYQARLFYDKITNPERQPDPILTTELARQRAYQPPAKNRDSKEKQVSGYTVPLEHTPVEESPKKSSATPAAPAGLLLPHADIAGCGNQGAALASADPENATVVFEPCHPTTPMVPAECTSADISAAEKTRLSRRNPISKTAAHTQIVTINQTNSGNKKPALIGVQCFDVPLNDKAANLLIHTKNVGLILDAEQAETEGAWSLKTEQKAPRGIGGGVRQTSSDTKGTISFGGGRLIGSFDVSVEGSFGAGVDLAGSFRQTSANQDGSLKSTVVGESVAKLRGAANGFAAIAREVPLTGSATLTNSAGTAIEVGRLFARPRDLPSACDIVLPITKGAVREIGINSPDAELGRSVHLPGLLATIVDIKSAKSAKEKDVARIAVGSYLSFNGLPRYTLVDWTEQFSSDFTYEGCDGVIRTAKGATRKSQHKDQLILDDNTLKAFAARAEQ